jgi:hypothetical protein
MLNFIVQIGCLYSSVDKDLQNNTNFIQELFLFYTALIYVMQDMNDVCLNI